MVGALGSRQHHRERCRGRLEPDANAALCPLIRPPVKDVSLGIDAADVRLSPRCRVAPPHLRPRIPGCSRSVVPESRSVI